MNEPHDLNQTVDIASVPADSLDAGLAAAFAGPRSSLGDMRPPLLKEAEGESAHIVQPKSDAMPSPDQIGDRYQLQGEIARGGMGAVLRGRDVDLGRDLAVKVLLDKHAHRPEVARRFIEEAQIGGQLQHPGVVPVYDIGRFGERPFFTMKLVKGQTLAALLSERDGVARPEHGCEGRGSHPQVGHALRVDAQSMPPELPRFLDIALKVAQTLAYAHVKGVIHRDLKPANIMVGAFGEVQVMDWGLAKVLAEGGIVDEEKASRERERPEDVTTIRTARSTGSTGSFGTETEAGSLLGTPAYMPPEQANGDIANLDRRADVFGLGAILCEILTGKPPYVGRSSEEVRRKAANGDLADAMARLDICGADPELIALTKGCLAAEAMDRPKDAQEVADRLSSYLNGVQERLQAVERERAVAVAREAEQRKRRKVQLALAAAVLGLMLGGGAFAWLQKEQAQAGRERGARNAEAVAALLGQAEEALKADDAAKAAVALEAARKRSAEGGAEQEAERLGRLEADLTLVRDLDAVDQFRWTPPHENKAPDPAAVATRIQAALARFGADPKAVPADDAAARVSASAVRERIVSALDQLLRQQKAAAARALLRRVDADPYRDAVRDGVLANATAKMAAAKVPELAGQPTALEQPPGFSAFLGEIPMIQVERRRHLLAMALRRRPGDPGLLMTLGFTYPINQADGANERLRWYQAAVAAAPAMPAAHNGLGVALRDKRDAAGAEAAFRKAIELDPKYAIAHNNLGAALIDKGRLDEAIASFRQAIELDPNYATAYNGMGNALAGKGQLDEAITWYHKAIARDRNYANAHANLGHALNDKGRTDEAIASLRTASKLDPKSANTHYYLGLALQGKGQVEAAIACWRKVIELKPKDAASHNNVGSALADMGRLDEAIACYRKAIELAPNDATAHYNLGNVLGAKGRVDAAIASWRKAIEFDPNYAQAYTNLGNALRDNGQVDEAIACCRKAIKLDPMLAEAHGNLGLALKAKGEVKEAIACLRKASALAPKLARVHFNLGSVVLEEGQTDEAIACFRQGIQLDPKNAAAHSRLGVALRRKGQVDAAITCLKKAIALDPKFTDAHSNLGAILCDVKHDYEGAVTCFRKAIALDPKSAQAYFSLGNALHGRGQVDQAMASWRKAIELDPKFADPHYNLGSALAEKGQLEEAITCYRTAIALAPNDAEAHRSLANALKDYAAAQYNLGNQLKDKGQLDKAIGCYQKAIELKPAFAQAHCNLGDALRQQGRFAESLTAVKRGHELGTKQPGWRYPSAQWVREAEQLAALEGKLPAFLKGEFKTSDSAERFRLAGVCTGKKLHAAAAGVYADAFAAEPKLADDLKAAHRYNAACSASLAAAGQSEDAPRLGDKEKARLRKQALDWLRADLALWTKQLDTGKPTDRTSAQKRLRHWRQDGDLAGIREAAALARLPAEERAACERLWADVAALLKKAQP
jgi:tetratricopeptide (TPR) repeat protein